VTREFADLREESRRLREEMRAGFAEMKAGVARIESTLDRRCADLVQCWFALWCATVAVLWRASWQASHTASRSSGGRAGLALACVFVGLALVAFAMISEDESHGS
jgi:hypothetical protein